MTVPNLREQRVNFVKALWQATTEKLTRNPERAHRKVDLRRLVLLSNVLHNCEAFAQEIRKDEVVTEPQPSVAESPKPVQEDPEPAQRSTVCSDITNSPPPSPQPSCKRPRLKRRHSEEPKASTPIKRTCAVPNRSVSIPPDLSTEAALTLISQSSQQAPLFLVPCEQNSSGQTVIFPSQAFLVVCPQSPTER